MASVSRCKPYLGTYVDISITGELSEMELHQLCSSAFSEIERIQDLMSFHEGDSELSRINKLPLHQSLPLSDEMLEVLTFAQALRVASSGVFDIGTASRLVHLKALPEHHFIDADDSGSSANLEINREAQSVTKTNPVTLDLGGIAKGYAVDKAFELLAQQNALSTIAINAGGDMRASPHQGQEITLRPPNQTAPQGMVGLMLDQACATSANTFTGEGLTSFIIDPIHDQCITDSRSITVFAPCCMHADALTKVCFLTKDKAVLRDILQHYNATHLEFS